VSIYVNHPTPAQEADIIANRTPNCSKEVHYWIAGFAAELRKFQMEKPPSISEMITLALAMERNKMSRITPEDKPFILPFIAKTYKDRKSLLKDSQFETLMDSADIAARELKESEEQKVKEVRRKELEELSVSEATMKHKLFIDSGNSHSPQCEVLAN
jgi:hypothetical protein